MDSLENERFMEAIHSLVDLLWNTFKKKKTQILLTKRLMYI